MKRFILNGKMKTSDDFRGEIMKTLKTSNKQIIEVDGLKFKDLNNNGLLDPYEDWRLSSQERAENLVSLMNVDEKIGMLMINQLGMGKAKKEGDNTQILDEEFEKADGTPMKTLDKYPTTETIEKLHLRHFILRDDMPKKDINEWINKLNEVAEATRLGIPVLVASNSRNEFASRLLDVDLDSLAFSLYPGTLGIAAAVQGDIEQGEGYQIIDDFAKYSRQEWLDSGIRKGYMYMADVVTDPRWQRTDGTFGERPELIGEIIGRLIDGFQGEELGDDSIALTIKHFPGGGARENGFDPHYKEGKWNIYRTEGSLETYHLPPFIEAAKHNPSSMMPYYSAPSIEKSHFQSFDGEAIPFEEVGMAFNHYILNTLLRDKLGFTGYINSDTGIMGKTGWGVEDLSVPGRFAKAINAGTDLISGTNQVSDLKKAINTHLISPQRIDQANINVLTEMFALGLFDDKTYIDDNNIVSDEKKKEAEEAAYQTHLKSVTLLKSDGVLPIKGQKVFVKTFGKDAEQTEKYQQLVLNDAKSLNLELVEDYTEADLAVLFLYPVSGSYFDATPGLLELEICEDKTNVALNGDTYTETTLSNFYELNKIVDYMHENGKKVVTSVNVIIPWILGNIEEKSDALLVGYDTFPKAVLEVVAGDFSPIGKLPLTLPKNSAVVAVDELGVSISRNDVPGYDKDKYLREGMDYAYIDQSGNEYKSGFGLTY